MDEIKEVYDSISSRIRSPYYGYFILFSAGFNWEAWLFLLFDNSPILERISYFDEHTSFSTVIAIPLALGFATALITPWLRLFFVWAASSPVTKANLQQAKAESEILEEKGRLERARAKFLGAEEESLIDQVRRDLEVRSIEDAEARNKLEKEIEELRRKSESPTFDLDAHGGVGTPSKASQLNVKLKKKSEGSGYRFYVKNTGNDMACNVGFRLLLDEGNPSPLTSDVNEVFPVKELHPEDEVSVLAAISMGMGSKFDAELTWETPSGEKKSKRTTVTL